MYEEMLAFREWDGGLVTSFSLILYDKNKKK